MTTYLLIVLTTFNLDGRFHEVRSSGSGPDGHLALNYWCHPPDASLFEAPYSSQFWERDWSSRNLPCD